MRARLLDGLAARLRPAAGFAHGVRALALGGRRRRPGRSPAAELLDAQLEPCADQVVCLATVVWGSVGRTLGRLADTLGSLHRVRRSFRRCAGHAPAHAGATFAARTRLDWAGALRRRGAHTRAHDLASAAARGDPRPGSRAARTSRRAAARGRRARRPRRRLTAARPAATLGHPRVRARASAPVAQLDRASVYGTEGQRFESSRARVRKAPL
jgi:hypothetical protein